VEADLGFSGGDDLGVEGLGVGPDGSVGVGCASEDDCGIGEPVAAHRELLDGPGCLGRDVIGNIVGKACTAALGDGDVGGELGIHDLDLRVVHSDDVDVQCGAENGLLDKSQLSPKEQEVIVTLAKKRGATDSPFKIIERETVTYKIVEAAKQVVEALKKAGITGNEIGEITPKMLSSGEWKNGTFRAYNISLQPARIIPGRTNPYVQFLESVKDKLCSLGFQEFDGPLVETEFWNGDALFMPQFHAARDIHDVYRIKNPTHAKSIEEPYLSNIAKVHENGGDSGSRGWNYTFDKEFTKRLILRSQGTVLSAHQLHKAEIPGKYFGIVRCFRYDKVDATHLSDFYQTEGIVIGKEANLRTLLGFLKMFATEIAGATEVKYVPGYFPFTEPSVEVHIKHPVLGWFELGGSGIFRPEVTKAMGIDVPVLAWGIGIDRMALMALGLNDLRELFCEDIERVRLRKAKF